VWVAARWRRKRGEKALAPTYLWPPEVVSWGPQLISEERAMVVHLRWTRRRKRRDPTTRARSSETQCIRGQIRMSGPADLWAHGVGARSASLGRMEKFCSWAETRYEAQVVFSLFVLFSFFSDLFFFLFHLNSNFKFNPMW
jgi:hypothetical protein